MTGELGLRERKKQQTRQLLFDTASRLFLERGFDAVTVAEVARAADVSEVTVFNYFPTKEDLFFGGMETFEERLLQAVRSRPPGESALTAFRRLILESANRLGLEEASHAIASAASVISGSQSLQVREREIVARYTDLLAEVLAQETAAGPDDLEPRGVASALMGVHRAVVLYARKRVLAGRAGRRLVADARAQAARAFDRLEAGLGGYAVR